MSDKNDDALGKLVRDDLEKPAPTADNPADQVVESAERQLKRARQFVVVYNLACIVAMFVAISSLFHTNSVKWMILYAIIFLVCFETTILMKLWYWVINVKCTLARDMKLMRLDLAKTTGIESVETEIPAVVTGYIRKQILWKIVIVALAIAGYYVYVGDLGGNLDSMVRNAILDGNESTFACQQNVRIDSTGTAEIASRYSFPNLHMFPVTTQTITERRLPGEQISVQPEFTDWSGEPLHARANEDKWAIRTTVILDPPVMPGERGAFKSSATYPGSATEKDEIWTWTDTPAWFGYTESQHIYLIELPEGAEVIDTKPQSAYYSDSLNGIVHIDMRNPRWDSTKDRIEIRYRLN